LHVDRRVILFALPLHEPLARALVRLVPLEIGHCSVERFANGELHAAIATDPAARGCVLLGSVAPPDADLLATLLLGHTLSKEGAGPVTAVLPYLGYARHDRPETGKSLATAWLGQLLRACGVADVVSVDVHSPRVHELFPVPVRSLSPATLFASRIAAGTRDVTIVAPDAGARERAEALRRAAGIERPVAHLAKQRTPEGVTHSTLHGEVSRAAVIVDDILDTGRTLVSACEVLRRAGVREVTVMVTHGLFTGTGWQRLWSLGVTRIVCTDTMPLPASAAASRVEVLSVAAILAEHLEQGERAGSA
jgi:ribose-phosphate pyrophosphokinase